MDPFLLASIIGGGAMLASGGASAWANSNLNKKNQEWQEKMVKQQRAYEEKIYNKRYSPAAQSQAKAAAGLNPFSGVETMNVGTSSSVPTPATNPYDFGDIGRAGEVVASGLQSRESMKLQREQFNQTVTNDTRKFLIDLKQLNLNEQELNAMIKSKEEEIRGMKLKNDIEELNLSMLQEFKNAGGNTFTDASNLTQAQTDYTNAKKEYQELTGRIASEQNEGQKKVLEAQAESLKASATQAYANAILANAQTEVAKSSKIKIDSETKIGKDKAAQDAALHELKLIEQNLINQGVKADNVRKELENTRNRILSGDIRNFGELGQFIYTHLHSMIPFSSTPLKFD